MDEISYSGSSSPRRRKVSKRAALFGLFALIILLLVLGVIFFVTRKGNDEQTTKTINLPPTSAPSAASITSSPTGEVSKTPTKAPTPTTSNNSKSSIKVAIENGSGESGVAAKASSVLKSAGYTIASTGNADTFDYTGVTIQVKTSEKSILTELKSDLSSDYTITSATSDLSEGQSYDALVIIGK